MKNRFLRIATLLVLYAQLTEVASAYSANKVWFEFRERGLYRVYVNYTVPGLRQYREAFVDFRNRSEAEKFYWDLIKGADFFPRDAANARFVNPPMVPDPW